MIPRRMLGFGFALFLMMVILALIYSQYAAQKMGSPVNLSTGVKKKITTESTQLPTSTPPVTADTATDDLIDEAVADRDDMTTLTDDEIADMEEGN